MNRTAKRLVFGALGVLVAVVAVGTAALQWRYVTGRRAADAAWQAARPARPAEVGATRTLAILPLVDWFAADPRLRGEAGVSYLIRTDTGTILFDVGANMQQQDPSPLQENMRRLGIALADVDTIVLSHEHMDHVGGLGFARRHSFSLGNDQADLRGKRIFVPVPMTYAGVAPTVSREPTVLAPGVVTTGAIAGQLYWGRVDEQALAIRVQGKGVVLVVGCGHQSLSRLLARSAQLFDEPVYAVVGGLHYPLHRGRMLTAGVDVQRLVAFGPFGAPTLSDLQRELDLLASKRPEWVSLSPHDSGDEAIAAFRRTFASRYHDLRVGEWQVISGPAPG
jgi:metal-dependent hydrolase (beta-lactamase superfamily II)